jgi:hypothetical protein
MLIKNANNETSVYNFHKICEFMDYIKLPSFHLMLTGLYGKST